MIWVFAVHTGHFVGFVMRRLKSCIFDGHDPRFLDRQVWAYSVDPDETALMSALFAILTASFGHIAQW